MKPSKLDREFSLAVGRGDIEIAKKLVSRGADVNTTSTATAQSTLLWLAVNDAGQEISKNFKDLAGGLAEFLPIVRRRDHTAKREQHLRVIKMLLEAKADVNKLSHGSTPLRIAVHRGDLEIVKLLLSYGASPKAETFSILSKLARKEGRKTLPGYYGTVLHEAAEKGSLQIVEALLEAGADPNRIDHEGKTPLAIAQEKGFTEIVALLQGRTTAQPAQPSDDIWRAASEGRLSDLQQFMAAGVTVNAADEAKATPLHKAAAAGHMHVVKWLLEQRADRGARAWSEAAQRRGSTPLHEAILAGRDDIAQYLVEEGANVNAKMSDRSTSLHLAAEAGKIDLVKFLVARKARVDAPERGRHTPFTIALITGHIEVADFLLGHGADPNQRFEPFNMTVLMHVAGQKLLKAVEFLLNAGADASLCDERGQNALHHAISGAVVHGVIEIGPKEDLPEGRREDALPIVERLVASGADPNAQDEEGITPLSWARKLRLIDVVTVLEKAAGAESQRPGSAD